MPKVMSLNLYHYHDWENRKNNIISLIKKQDPDWITLQEVQTNLSFSAYPQSDFIADNCGYKFRVFAPTLARSNAFDKNGNRTQRASYGQAFLSKYPIVSSDNYFLQLYPDFNEEMTVLFCKIDINGKFIDLCDVHFANTGKHSDLHLNELMDLCEKRKIKPIIMGDFNILDLSIYKSTRLKDYILSTDITKYISYPAHNQTLDYIIVPRSMYDLSNVSCLGEYVSDHKALFADVKIL